MKKSLILLSLLALTACNSNSAIDPVDTTISTSSLSSSVSSEVVQSLHGTVETIGISVYMEGTHKLLQPDGSFVLLQSDAVDLNGYVGEYAIVTGKIHATVEADGLIMNVDTITLSANSASSTSSDTMSLSTVSSDTASSLDVTTSTSATQSIVNSVNSLKNTSSSMQSVQTMSTTTEPQYSTDDAAVRTLANLDYSPAKWTSEYCSKSEPFCIPIHKSWWYQGYLGTTTDRLSVEISSVEIQNKGEGKIVVRLLTGSIDSVGATDGQIKKFGTTIIGYKAWTNNRRFEVTGHESLQTPIQYILQNLKTVAN